MTNSLLARKREIRHRQLKLQLTQVAQEMHRERDDKGSRLFVGGDCLSSQQIGAYFSRLAATKKKHGSLNAAASSEEVEEFLAQEQMQEHKEDISLTVL